MVGILAKWCAGGSFSTTGEIIGIMCGCTFSKETLRGNYYKIYKKCIQYLDEHCKIMVFGIESEQLNFH